MAGIQLVVFDLDDTLFDHAGAVEVGLGRWLPELGVPDTPPTRELWRELEERHWARLRAGETSFQGQRRARIVDFLTALGCPAPDRQDTVGLDAHFSRYLQAYRSGWSAFPDAPGTVERLASEGLRVAVLTNGHEQEQSDKLRAIGLGALIPRLYCADRLGVTKPDPRAYRAVADRCAVVPEAVLHVGDRPDLDVAAPRSVGMRAVLVDRSGAFPDHADRVSNLEELLP